MQYYDIIYGINAWPSSYVWNPVTGAPVPIGLPAGYSFLPAIDPLWIQENLPVANLAYLAEYPNLALAAYNMLVFEYQSSRIRDLVLLLFKTPDTFHPSARVF